MKYKATKTITRYLTDKSVVQIEKDKTYSEEKVKDMPTWYISSGYLIKTS